MAKEKHKIGLYSTEEAANIVGITPHRIRQLIKENLVTPVRVGRYIMIDDEGIAQMKARNTKPGPTPKKPIGGKAA